MRVLPLLSLLLLTPGLRAADRPAPALAAIITTEQRHLTSDGLSKQVHFQERFLRVGDRVWLERIIPPGAPAEEASPEGGHRHLDLDRAARLVQRQSDGQLKLTFIHREERTVVATEPRDHPEVGFHDSWGVVAHLMDPELLVKLPPLPKRPAAPGTRWHGRKTAQGWLRVLWSERLQVALAVESASADGHRVHRTTVRLAPMPKVLPWDQVGDYRQKDYTDLLD